MLTIMANSVKKITDLDYTRLPPAPHVLIKLIDLCHRTDVSFEELEAIIEKDTALCAKVITISNSAAYSQWNETRELKRILVVLGTKTIKSIALTSAVHQFFSQFSQEMGEALGSAWLDALICAHLARKLAALTGYPYPDEAHLAGLIHQIGQLILYTNDPQGYQKMMSSVPDQNALMFKEVERYGKNSADLAADVVAQWGVDSILSDAVRYQHKPATLLLDTHPLIRLTNLSSQLCNRLNHNNRKYLVEDQFFGLNQSIIENLVLESTQLAVSDAREFGIQVDEDHTIPRANVDQESIRIQLARKMRQIALLEGVQKTFDDVDDLSEMIQLISDQMLLLFGFSASMFFFPDSEQTVLNGFASHSKNIPASGSYTIKLKSRRSLIAEAALQQQLKITGYQADFNELPIIDVQILSTLVCSNMISLPLRHQNSLVGVIAIGCNPEQAEKFHNDDELLDHFATIVADAFVRQKSTKNKYQQQLVEKETERNLHTRKVIHEVNNPLSIINNYLELLSMGMDPESDNIQHLETIKSEVQRVSKILLQLKNEPQIDENHTQLDINQLISNMLELFKPTLYKINQIKSELQLDPTLPSIQTDQNKLKQIITNLVKNAAEALEENGTIGIKTRALVVVNKKQYVEITISDDGAGLPASVIENLFTPIQTKKGPEHSGLGLTIVNKLVSELNGHISYTTSDRGGAEFIILLPR
jgi:signal transduction histidine kinase